VIERKLLMGVLDLFFRLVTQVRAAKSGDERSEPEADRMVLQLFKDIACDIIQKRQCDW
jgi:hypothetical protein